MVSMGLCKDCKSPHSSGKQRCDPCRAAQMEKHRRKQEDRSRLGLCVNCKAEATPGLKKCQKCTIIASVHSKKITQRAKIHAMNAYGGCQCACCGETNLPMLSLDHINQDGAEDRRRNASLGNRCQYKILKSLGYPPGFRVLCYNCNVAVFRDPNHICPHRTGCFADCKES